MARLELRLPENAPGDLFVDETCIDCETCRFVAPEVFVRSASGRSRGLSIVARQPEGAEGRQRALMALVSCPTASIGCVPKPPPAEMDAAQAALPEPVDGPVYYCGYAAESSFGASSYLVRRPEADGGNILVDSPRAVRPLLKRIEALGGARLLFLTHKDDVADHATLHRRLGCARVMHRSDMGLDTSDIERPLEGDAPVELARGVLAIPVPGHTRGSCALLVDDTYLFTGDHLAGEEGALTAWRDVSWYSWEEQVKSLRKLLDYSFEWVLPGHGRRYHAESPQEMRRALEALLQRL